MRWNLFFFLILFLNTSVHIQNTTLLVNESLWYEIKKKRNTRNELIFSRSDKGNMINTKNVIWREGGQERERGRKKKEEGVSEGMSGIEPTNDCQNFWRDFTIEMILKVWRCSSFRPSVLKEEEEEEEEEEEGARPPAVVGNPKMRRSRPVMTRTGSRMSPTAMM